MLGCVALGMFQLIGGTAAFADGVVQADSSSFVLDTTDTEKAGGASQADSPNFTLNTTDTTTEIGGTAQRGSRDFTLNTTGESPSAYADSADFTLDTQSAVPPRPASLSGMFYTGRGEFAFTVSGEERVKYVIQANADLNMRDWVSIFTNRSPFTFTDLSAGKHERRFYRAVALP